jgi:hypothetical protein
MNRRPIFGLLAGLVLTIIPCSLFAQESGVSAGDFVRDIYRMVSAKAGSTPDWDTIRACFIKEAVIVLRTSRTEMSVFSVDGFIKDFVEFYNRPFNLKNGLSLLPKRDGFVESVIKANAWEYGNIAHVLVHYTAQISGNPLPPQHGLDTWTLLKRDGAWFISSVSNEILRGDLSLPPGLDGE